MRKKILLIPLIALAFFFFQSHPVFACGGLVAPDGDVRLSRATTLIAWHNGIEHYLTSFAYQGSQKNIGWIVPLPAVPEKIEAGGAWTFQRLNIETHPQRKSFFGEAPVATSAQVLQQVQVEALNITVIKGSGEEIINWATENNFFIDAETHAHLLVYAKGSPIFMAAKYDTHLAAERHQLQGDGVPLLITMKTPHPWVPIEVLAIEGEQVQADLYFLTDMPLNVSDLNAKVGLSAVGNDVPGAAGLKFVFQEQLSEQLYKDLSSDRNMSWIRSDSWLTYLTLDAPETQVHYDLGVSNTGVIRLAPYGTPPAAVVDGTRSKELPSWIPTLPLNTPQWIVGSLITILTISLGIVLIRRTRSKRAPQTA